MPPRPGSGMTGRPWPVVAVQALVVAALALTVVLTLLRPDDDEPLFGVSAPLEDADRAVRGYDHPNPAKGAPRDHGPAHGPLPLTGSAAGEVAGSAYAGVSASGPTAADPSSSPGAGNGGGDDESPTADQYDDALARLAAKLQ